ncbi:hypothetical protein PI124_g16152 [Phytophthora idaei]|nr:hypothetical protein PI125_g16481 [Phytophthora idaei]KAG3238899.1 hypothetical protein PI124_g16152 [Phytophthora idaei]
MIFDTITSDVWVPTTAPGHHYLYNHSASSTYQANGSYFNSPYVAGILSGDVLRIGDLELSGQFFGEATDTSRENPSAKFDGFFGLGFDATSQALVETPLHHMMRQGALDRKMLSVYIGRNGNPGELMLEGYDSNWFKGELIYMNTASPVAWDVWLDEIQVGGLSISDGTAVTTSTMAVFVFGPSEKVSRFAEKLGDKEELPGSGVYSIDCAADPPDVTFVVDGHPFSISKVDYILPIMDEKCLLAFVGGIPSWILGTAVLRKFYTVFDMDGKAPRIGLAMAT